MRRIVLFLVFASLISIILFNCGQDETNPYRNVADHQAEYVGMEACRQCHNQVYETFIQTGMGQSWGIANKAKSAADFSPAKALVYDSIKDFYYKPYWDGDSLAILEYRLNGKDTVHKRLEKVSYIVGSGQHTNSHIININGYLHQAPITFYTQKGKWDLAPGFEGGMNSRFDRKIELECISCHNGYPGFVEGSLNKYNTIKLGIDCERCHGPGSLHVNEKKKGEVVDTSKGPDYSIVNPRRLSTEQQNNLCMRCHLQGITVLNDDKSFFDFKPSQMLKHTMNTFMPSYAGSENHMIMASHVERMKMSNCYIKSEKMSCITCHNPHVSVKFTPIDQYNKACASCHTQSQTCTENPAALRQANSNCVQCHMPKNGSIDIPHVAVTDHFIRKKLTAKVDDNVSQFIGMICYNNANVDPRTQARSYLEFFERYQPQRYLLDSAIHYLTKAGIGENDPDPDMIRTYFLLENYTKILEISKSTKADELKDAWTAYRIGESYTKVGKPKEAISFLQRSVTIKPLALDFKLKLSTARLAANNMEQAKKLSFEIIAENPRYAMAHFNLGYIALQEGQLTLAQNYLQKALSLNPDHTQSLINMAVILYQQNQKKSILPFLQRALKLEPHNEQVKAMMQDLQYKP
jgi:tetratricopeptide (TPR) repeat protein